MRSRIEGVVVDNYQYHLSGAQLSELYYIVQRLVSEGYTWHHRHTQCVLHAVLARYRHGSTAGSIPTVCADGYLREGPFEGSLMNFSRPGIQRTSPNVKTHPSKNYDKESGDFRKFMQGLQAEDLLKLKHFLLDGYYKRPETVKTVPGIAKPSKFPSTEDVTGTFLQPYIYFFIAVCLINVSVVACKDKF